MHGGFGEMTEDLIELTHQSMQRFHQRFAGLGSTKNHAVAFSKAEKRDSLMEVIEHAAAVKEASKRKLKKNDTEIRNNEAKEGCGTKRKVEMQKEVQKAKGKRIDPRQDTIDELKKDTKNN
jgi:hypothetical protein